MAIAYINAALRGIRGITPVEKLIIVILADYARAPGGISWPSVETIAWEACIGRRQATAHLTRLRAAGWIEAMGSRRGGRGKSTRYQLNLARIIESAEHAKHARTRMVKRVPNSAAARAVFDAQTMQSSAANHAEPGTKPCSPAQETMRPAAYEPLGLPVITSTGLSRTSKPVEKDQDHKTENPTSKALVKLATRQRAETDEPDTETIEARRRSQLKAAAEWKG